MNVERELLGKIPNPFLYGINEGGIRKRGFSDLAWNESLGLFAASYANGEEFERFKIIVTDLEGTSFNEYTSGFYRNRHPMWTHDGNIIFTERRDPISENIDSELKIIELETGEIRPFFSDKEYPEIEGIGTSTQ